MHNSGRRRPEMQHWRGFPADKRNALKDKFFFLHLPGIRGLARAF
jgi:hypothetical protein